MGDKMNKMLKENDALHAENEAHPQRGETKDTKDRDLSNRPTAPKNYCANNK